MIRYLFCLLGELLAVPDLAVIVLAFQKPITISGIGYLVAYFLIVAGLMVAPWNQKFYLVTLVGVIAIALIAGTRLFLARNPTVTQSFKMVTLPQGKEARWLNYLIDEQDTIVFGETLFHYIGGDSSREHKNLDSAFSIAYSEMKAAEGIVPSPVLSTYLNFQRPDAFDTIIIRPTINQHPDMAVVFLHGYMGNVSVQCWEIAQAASTFGAVTVCPSTDWTGAWWQPEGEAILRATFGYLREQGIEKFYLGGFSNGGFGISRLVSEISKEGGLTGLFFIDGIYDGASIKETGLPVLIIQGTQDERVPVGEVRQIAEAIGDLGTYVEVDSDHFLIMKQPQSMQNAIVAWLENLEP